MDAHCRNIHLQVFCLPVLWQCLQLHERNRHVRRGGQYPTRYAGDGRKGLAYQIRSADQLQFINWSYVDGTGSATRLVTKNNYKLFPYLQYTNSTGTAKQTRTDAERNRPAQSWQQTHDLNGANQEAGKAEKQENNRQFYPIAGAVDHITTNNS